MNSSWKVFCVAERKRCWERWKRARKKASAFKESVEPLSCLPFELINVSNYRQREMEGGHNHSMLMPVGRQWSTGRQGRDSKHQAESAFSSSLGIRSRLMLNGVFFFFIESGQLVFSRRSFQVSDQWKGGVDKTHSWNWRGCVTVCLTRRFGYDLFQSGPEKKFRMNCRRSLVEFEIPIKVQT